MLIVFFTLLLMVQVILLFMLEQKQAGTAFMVQPWHQQNFLMKQNQNGLLFRLVIRSLASY